MKKTKLARRHLAAARLSDRGVLGMDGLLGPFPASREENRHLEAPMSFIFQFHFLFLCNLEEFALNPQLASST